MMFDFETEWEEYDPIQIFGLKVNKDKIESWLDSKLKDLKEGRVHSEALNFQEQAYKVFDLIIEKSKKLTLSNIEIESPELLGVICMPLIAYQLQKEGLIKLKYARYAAQDLNRKIILYLDIKSPNCVHYISSSRKLIFNNFLEFEMTKLQGYMLEGLFMNENRVLNHNDFTDYLDNNIGEELKNKGKNHQELAKYINKKLKEKCPSLGDFLNTIETRVNTTNSSKNLFKN